MAQHGGYRKPANPAPVSGPGALSQRTDGGPADTQAAKYVSGLPYGEGQALMDIQSAAPMAAAAETPQPAPIVPIHAPTQRVDEPVTHGANAGAGPDMTSLGLQSPVITQYQSAKDLITAMSQAPDASPALKFLAQRYNGAY